MEYGLIGKNLNYSYSKIIHEKFGLYKYDLFSINNDEFNSIMMNKNFKGLNVTMPYKKEVIRYCKELSKKAKKIGSVNTVTVNNGILKGFNTDYDGLAYTMSRSKIFLNGKKILILGSGGTSFTAKVLSEDSHASEILVVSRSGKINYKNIYDHIDADIIINTTPVGMYPANGDFLVDIKRFKNLSGYIDVIYNPLYSRTLLEAKKCDIPVAGGLPMLVYQAKKSAEIFTASKIEESVVEEIISELYKQLCNVVLIGMPGSGKTSVGRIVAKELNKKFIDMDSVIEKKHGLAVFNIFKNFGEKIFRKSEKETAFLAGCENNTVISTGGGVVLDSDNYFSLKQNGRIYNIKRDLNYLAREGRPLSKNLNELKKISIRRKHLYSSFCDFEILNDSDLLDTVKKIVRDFNENNDY